MVASGLLKIGFRVMDADRDVLQPADVLDRYLDERFRPARLHLNRRARLRERRVERTR